MGAPQPAGTPLAAHSITAPSELPAFRAASINASQRQPRRDRGRKSGLRSISFEIEAGGSMASPPISATQAWICTSGITSRATPPAATRSGFARARPAAAAIIADAIFGVITVIGMARAIGLRDVAIILRTLVDIFDHQADRCAGGLALEGAGKDADLIGLLPLRRVTRLAGTALVEIGLDVSLTATAAAGSHRRPHRARGRGFRPKWYSEERARSC